MSDLRFTVFAGISQDGFLATTDGSLEWLEQAADASEDYGFDTFLASVDAMVLGRASFDHVRTAGEFPFGDLPVYVMSHRDVETDWPVTRVSGSVTELCNLWQRNGHRHMSIDGANVLSQFLVAGLVDELILTFAPVELGEGIALFSVRADADNFVVIGDDQRWPSGMVQRRYKRRSI